MLRTIYLYYYGTFLSANRHSFFLLFLSLFISCTTTSISCDSRHVPVLPYSFLFLTHLSPYITNQLRTPVTQTRTIGLCVNSLLIYIRSYQVYR